MNDDWRKLTQYLIDCLPKDLPYDDLAQLCIGIHIYVDGIPDELFPILNKDNQAMAFAEFVRQRFDDSYGYAISGHYGASYHRPTEKGHWIEVIASIYKDGTTFDRVREKAIRDKITANHAMHQRPPLNK